MPATSDTPRTSRGTYSHLPLTPKVMSSRRGGHFSPLRTARRTEVDVQAATPALHVSPNVISAPRGGVPTLGVAAAAKALRVSPLVRRRFRY